MSTKPDIRLTIQGQNGSLPFPLRIMEQDGSKLWKVGQLERGNVDSSVSQMGYELKLEQTDWSGGQGHGLLDSLVNYASGRDIDTTLKGKFFLGPLVNTTTITNTNPVLGFVEFGGTVYCWTSKAVFSHSAGTWTSRFTTAQTIKQLFVFGSYMFVAINGAAYEYTADGTSYTTSTLSDTSALGFAIGKDLTGLNDILYKFGDNNEIKTHTTGINGAEQWSSAYYIGDSSRKITSVFLGPKGEPLIGKHSGLHRLNSDGSTNVILKVPSGGGQTIDNFEVHAEYQSGVYFSVGSKLGEIFGSNIYDIMGPLDNTVELDLSTGYIKSITSDESHLYVIAQEGTSQIIYKGIPVNGEWTWCPWAYYSSASGALNGLFMDSSVNPRVLWFGRGTTPCYFIVTDDPIGDSNARFCSSGYLITGWFDAGARSWTKLIQSVIAETRASSGDLSADIKVTISYEIDESGSWVQIDTAYTDNSPASGVDTIKYINLNTVDYKKIRFKIQLDSNTNTITPIVKFFGVYGQLHPTPIITFETVIDANDGYGGLSSEIRSFLEAGRPGNSGAGSTALMTLEDRFETNHYVVFAPGYPKEIEIKDQAAKSSRLGIQLVMIKVDWS